MDYSKPFLGKLVKVKMDRMLGSRHPKYDFEYPINYGYIPDTAAPDGDELDAYVVGVDEPIKDFMGRCIAIIHRTNDNDDKLVVCEDGKSFTDDEIREATYFQERWFESVIMRP